MSKIYIYIFALVALVIAGCAKDAGVDGGKEGEGRLILNMKFNGEALTRADAPSSVLVKIANSKGVIYKYEDIDDVPGQLWLIADDYTITVEAGEPVAYSWDSPYYVGSEEFTIKGKESTAVTVDCPIQNTLVTVVYDDTVKDGFSDYAATIYPVPGDDSVTLVFDENGEQAVAYITLEDGQTTIPWSFAGTHLQFGTVERTGTLTGLVGSKKYALTFKYTDKSGTFELSVTVDESTVDSTHDITIYQRPAFSADFDFADTQTDDEDIEILLTASSDIVSVVLSGSVFGEGYDLLDAANDPGDYGVAVDVRAGAKIAVTLTTDLFEMMSAGLNEVTITVTDQNAKENSVVLKVDVVAFTTAKVQRSDVWATFATLRGVVVEESVGTVSFLYRPTGDTNWNVSNATEEGNGEYSAKITGLAPGTDYEATIEVDGVEAGKKVTFTTEEATQPRNPGFEEYGYDNSSGFYFYTNAEDKFWDCGNKGTMTMNRTVTNPSTDVPLGSDGISSVQMASAFIGLGIFGKFAAGNLYAGDYAGTFLTNGYINFGREFSSRPSAMSFWYKANAGTVDYAGGDLSKGDTDLYRVFIALTDWSGEKSVGTSGSPTAPREGQKQIYTGNQSSFIDWYTDPGIIAFGEYISSDPVSEWTYHKIDLDYRSTERIPTGIVILATSSMYGDYFAGSTSSWMYIDDVELFYE